MPFDCVPREQPKRPPHGEFAWTLTDEECMQMLRILGSNTPRMIALRVLERLGAPDDLARILCSDLPTYGGRPGFFYPRAWCGV